MTLADVAWRNVSRSFRSFRLYLFSIAFNVFVFYLFSSARHDPAVDGVIKQKAAFGMGMLVASAVIAIFAAVFMWYSSSFFLRRRTREIGLYGLFGVPKATVSFMFFAENMLSGAIALACGLAAGIPFSKLFMMAVLRIMDLDAAVTLRVSPMALAETAIVFASLMAVASLAAAWRVYRFRLADTFRAEKEAEKRPRGSLWLGAASVVVIAAGYVLSAYTTGLNLIPNFFIVSGLTIVGTWGFARGGGSMAVSLLKGNKRVAASGPRLIALGNLYFRIGSGARVFFAIAIVSTVSMVALGVGVNLKATTQRQMFDICAYTMSYAGAMPAEKAKEILTGAGAKVTAQAQERILMAHWENKADRTLNATDRVRIISGADYLSLLPASEREKAENILEALPPGGLAVIAPYTAMAKDWLKADFELSFGEGPGARVSAPKRLERPGINLGMGMINMVAPESLFLQLAEAHPQAAAMLTGLSIANEKHGADAAKALERSLGSEADFFSRTFWIGIIKIYDMALFVGVLIGAVFLISSCSVLHFKQLMDAADDSQRHEILYKIGLSDRDARRIAFMQTIPMYALPLGMACLHSVVALSVMEKVLEDDFALQIWCVVAAFSAVFLAAGARTTRSCLELMKRSAAAANQGMYL
jgi:putative ABC transport system permease protein